MVLIDGSIVEYSSIPTVSKASLVLLISTLRWMHAPLSLLFLSFP